MDSSPGTVLYHFVLTLQRPIHGGGMVVDTWSSTLSVPPGASRRQAYLDVRAWVASEDPGWASANVLHWSLEPDALPHPAAPVPPAVLPPAGARDALPHQRQGE